MNSLSKCDVFLIVLTGQGDTDVGLVNQETWDWIISDYMSNKSSYEETVPKTVLDAYPNPESFDQEITICYSTYENDRALLSPKQQFTSVKEAMQFIKKNKCTLKDEFHGCLY